MISIERSKIFLIKNIFEGMYKNFIVLKSGNIDLKNVSNTGILMTLFRV